MGEPVSRHPLSWLREVLSVDGSDPRDSTDPEGERRPARLFECTNCETTYIGVDKQSCSKCDGSVRPIPNETDLQQVRRDG